VKIVCARLPTNKQPNRQTNKQGRKHNLRPTSLAEVKTGTR